MAKKKTPPPIYVRPTAELRASLDQRCADERRSLQTVVLAAVAAYLSTPVRP